MGPLHTEDVDSAFQFQLLLVHTTLETGNSERHPHEKFVSFLPLSRLKYSQTSVVANNLQISYSVKYWPRVSERPFARVLEGRFRRVPKRPPYRFLPMGQPTPHP